MLTSLKLTNFGCHQDLTVQFTAGLNVFRASNEAGKSTVLKALAYALWGAKGLPASLADTVTWGQPVSSLRVVLDFSVNDVKYHIKRSQSGAELTSEGLIVTGQTETADYISTLLGTTADIASSTSLASQKDIEAALNTDTGGLITTLANLDLIPKSIEAVREKHPSGSTKFLESQLEAIVDLPPFEVNPDLEVEVGRLAKEASEANEACKTAQLTLLAVNQQVKAASAVIAKYEHSVKYRASLEAALATTETTKVSVPQAPAPLQDAEEALLAAVNDRLMVGHYKTFEAFDTSLCGFADSKPDLNALKSDREIARGSLEQAKNRLLLLNQQQETTGQCSFCGEDFSTLPSVIKARQELDSQVVYWKKEVEHYSIVLAQLAVRIASTEELQRLDTHVRSMRGVKLDEFFWPAKPSWAEDRIPTDKDTATLTEQVRVLRVAHAEYAKKLAAYNKAVDYRVQLQEALAALPEIDVTEAREVLAQQEQATASVAEANNLNNRLNAKLTTAKRMLSEQSHRAEFTAMTNAANTIQREKLRQSISEMQVVNGLITKLRDCRPAVTNKLWSMLVDAVSTTFSQMRGVPSLVTRADTKGFLVDGKTSQVFSGSTQDILALALRQTLVKVFLPYVDFMILDEPAAGCDADRETALIAAVAKAGFNQVLLVTHSTLADGFASNLITLD